MTQTKYKLVIVDEPYHKWSEVCAVLRKENKRLKELLKELRMSVMFDKDLVEKIDEVLK